MKKIFFGIGLFTLTSFDFHKQPRLERNYVFQVPESKINIYISILQGRLQDITGKDYNEVVTLLLEQTIIQDNAFWKEDSAFKARQKEIKTDPSKQKKP